MHCLHFYFETMTIVYSHKVGDVVTTNIVTEACVRERLDDLRTGENVSEQTIIFDPEKPELSLSPLQVWLVRGFRGVPQELRGKP